jgi:proteasome accessory factor C
MSRPSAQDRLRRILAAVPWVVAANGPRLSEVCTRFGYASEDDLRDDLELLFMCGVPPYTPDCLIEVEIENERLWIRYAPLLSPLSLTPTEALALVASSAALLSTREGDSNDPLSTALAKLALALGVEGDDVVGVELGAVVPDTLARMREASAEHRQVEIDYYGYGRDEHTTRIIDPYVVYTTAGQWYVAAYCHLAQDERLFRIDRVTSVRLLDSTFSPPPTREPPASYRPGPDDARVVLDLEPDAAWVVEQYPVEARTVADNGRQRVALRASGRAWLERLLLRLGPDVTIVEGDADIARAAANRILARYGVAEIPAGEPVPSNPT